MRLVVSLPLAVAAFFILANAPIERPEPGQIGGPARSVSDNFEGGELALRWNPVQAIMRLIRFAREEPREGRLSLEIAIDQSVHSIPLPLVEDDAPLGQSLVDVNPVAQRGSCFPPQNGTSKLNQRNEIREAGSLKTDFGSKSWYAFSFRVIGEVPECGSVRWVIGQWKQGRLGGEDDSPFLAQRIDNGVFHITVQDGSCRCRIAQARGDPDAMGLSAAPIPMLCQDVSGPAADTRVPCSSALKVEYGDDPTLPDPRLGWVDMLYEVKGRGAKGDGLVSIFANGRFIAKVTGPIGYENQEITKQYFKIGHYRDMMPGYAALLLDCYWKGDDPAERGQACR